MPGRPETHDRLLEGARHGQVVALEAIYRELHPHVLAYLRAHARDVAEDLAADTFVALAGALPSFSGDWDGLRALTFTIAKRRAQDHHRTRARRRTDPSIAAIDTADHRDAVQGALGRIGEEEARRLIASLPPDQAQVVLLRILGDLSVEQTAEIVGKRPGAVRALQFRALKRLARELRVAEAAPAAPRRASLAPRTTRNAMQPSDDGGT